jgi:hypothetical protein
MYGISGLFPQILVIYLAIFGDEKILKWKIVASFYIFGSILET